MAKLPTVSGVTGVGLFALGLGLPKLIEGLPSYVSYGVTGIGAILVLVAMVWTLLNKGGDSGEVTTTLTSHGHQSPNYARVEGGVHNYFAPPSPPAPEPQTSPWDDPEFSLNSATRMDADVHGAVPDMDLREVCERLYDSLGGPPQLIGDFEARVDRAIKDNVRYRRLHTWGRKNDPDAGLEGVWADAWLKGKFSHKLGSVRFRHPDNPRSVHEWTDLHFNRKEVDKWLPRKPEYEIQVF